MPEQLRMTVDDERLMSPVLWLYALLVTAMVEFAVVTRSTAPVGLALTLIGSVITSPHALDNTIVASVDRAYSRRARQIMTLRSRASDVGRIATVLAAGVAFVAAAAIVAGGVGIAAGHPIAAAPLLILAGHSWMLELVGWSFVVAVVGGTVIFSLSRRASWGDGATLHLEPLISASEVASKLGILRATGVGALCTLLGIVVAFGGALV